MIVRLAIAAACLALLATSVQAEKPARTLREMGRVYTLGKLVQGNSHMPMTECDTMPVAGLVQ